MRGFSLGVEHSLYTKYIHEISGLESVFRQKTSTRIRSPSDDVIPDRNKMIKMFMLQIGNLETVWIMNLYSLLEINVLLGFSNFKFRRCNCLYKTSPTKFLPLPLFEMRNVSPDYPQTSFGRVPSCTSLFYWYSYPFPTSSLTLHFLSCYIFFLPQFFFFFFFFFLLSPMLSIHVDIFLSSCFLS
jgi:hypothetical protein